MEAQQAGLHSVARQALLTLHSLLAAEAGTGVTAATAAIAQEVTDVDMPDAGADAGAETGRKKATPGEPGAVGGRRAGLGAGGVFSEACVLQNLIRLSVDSKGGWHY